MARGTMHPQKPEGQRRRRNAPTLDSQTITPDDVVRGPALEDATGLMTWSRGTYRWYHTWRTSPQAQLFLPTDWERLILLAPMVENYLKRPTAAAMSEIRMNEERLGATVVDRLRARIGVAGEDDLGDETSETSSEGPTNVTSIANRLRREA